MRPIIVLDEDGAVVGVGLEYAESVELAQAIGGRWAQPLLARDRWRAGR